MSEKDGVGECGPLPGALPSFAPLLSFTHQEVVFGPGTASDPVTVTGREGANQNRGRVCPHIPAEETLEKSQKMEWLGP